MDAKTRDELEKEYATESRKRYEQSMSTVKRKFGETVDKVVRSGQAARASEAERDYRTRRDKAIEEQTK